MGDVKQGAGLVTQTRCEYAGQGGIYLVTLVEELFVRLCQRSIKDASDAMRARSNDEAHQGDVCIEVSILFSIADGLAQITYLGSLVSASVVVVVVDNRHKLYRTPRKARNTAAVD